MLCFSLASAAADCAKCWAKPILLSQTNMFWLFPSSFDVQGHLLITKRMINGSGTLAFTVLLQKRIVNLLWTDKKRKFLNSHLFLVKFTPLANMFLYQFNYFCGQVLELCPHWLSMNLYQFNYFCGQVLELCPDWLSMKGCEFNQKRCEFKNVLKKMHFV